MFTSYAQLSMSWYMFLFQLPLADFVVPMDDYKFLDTMWRSWSPGYEPSEDLAKVKEAIGAPENFQAAIGYYRAMFDDAPADPAHAHFFERRFDRPSVPTLYLHGIDDGCVGIHNIGDPSPFLAEGSRVEFINLAGHFLHLEQPEIVNAHIADWLGA
jgi:pimeloyl-ACP methyl ester carboxylesterase